MASSAALAPAAPPLATSGAVSRRALWSLFASWALPAVLLALTALAGSNFKPLQVEEMSAGQVFVLGITVIGATSGLARALVAALVASVIFEFFFVAPLYELSISTPRELLPPLIFTICGAVSGSVAGQLKDRSAQLARTNRRLEALLEASRLLQAAADADAVEAAVSGPIADLIAGLPSPGKVDKDWRDALDRLIALARERAQLANVLANAQASARTEELKTALLASVSHDLRTPLAAISASASSLIDYADRIDKQTAGELLQNIVGECNRLNQFTSNLLELSRLEAGGTGISGQVLAVSDVVRAVLQRKRARWPGRPIELVASDADLLVHADTALFDLALTNVIENALRYSPARAPVTVACARDGQACTIAVTDEGLGIPPAEQARVFERFYRIRRSEGSPGGSGLGLAIARGFVEAFGGAIAITSPLRDGKGTTVTIRLPLFEDET